MNCSTGNKMSDAVAELNITGNVIPSVWFKTIVNDKGRPYMLAIMILSEVVYWYRPVECRDEKTGEFLGYKTKFRQDVLQKSYKDLAEYYQVTKRQVTDAIVVLEKLGVVKREFRTVFQNGVRCNNVLFIHLNVGKLRDLTYPHSDDDNEDKSKKDKGSSPQVSAVDEAVKRENLEKNVDSVDNCTTLSRKNGIGYHEILGHPLPEKRETNTETTNRRLLFQNPISSNHLARDKCIDLFAEQISYDLIRCDFEKNESALAVLDQCVEIAVTTLMTSKQTVLISGDMIPAGIVKSRLLMLDLTHMKYVVLSFLANKKKVKKIQSYLLACMFNAITSIDVTVANDLARNGYFDERGNPV